ncbi:hypothetical protein AK830_g2092 [Neonectria ditissima]|uniref:Uncharacterized protein n=1 Tax=Neonectria ditissima TaxID=78410 RepID=A0A0P7BL46_9HYPO|nr:hypothetical protein AK830_g2092 [Neonectria ditissima]
MNWYTILFTLALAVPSFAATLVDGYDRVYFYVIYDLDVTVWGPGKGYVAPKCLGSRSDKSCTFDEFINFIEFGEASSSPSYYTLDSGYTLTIGTVVTSGAALLDAFTDFKTFWENLIPERASQLGIWNDLGFVVDQATSVAPQRDIPIARHLKNAEMMLGAVSQARSAQLNSKTFSLLTSNVKDVIWQIVEKESSFVPDKWKEINWDETIKKYPDMSDPSSTLFKKVTAELRTLHGNNAVELSVRRKVMDMVHLCFGG